MQSKPQKSSTYQRLAARTTMEDQKSRQQVSFQSSTAGGENVMTTLSSAEGTTVLRNLPRNM